MPKLNLYKNGKTPEGEKLNIDPKVYREVLGLDGAVNTAIAALREMVGLDDNAQVFAARALEAVKSQIYKVEYPQKKARKYIPASGEKGQHIRQVTFREYDYTGFAKIMTSLADDAPLINVRGKEFTINVKKLRNAYMYDVDDLAEAAHANVPLNTMQAEGVRESFEQAIEKLAWLGDEKEGIPGLIYNPNITAAAVPDAAGGGANPKRWVNKTNDEILADMTFAVTNPEAITNGVEDGTNTLLMPIEQFNLIRNRRMASGTDTTILEFFKRNNPGVEVDSLIWLKDLSTNPATGAAGPVDALLAYNRNPTRLTMEIPMELYQAPPEARNLAWVVNCMIHYAGILVYRPLSVHVSTGI